MATISLKNIRNTGRDLMKIIPFRPHSPEVNVNNYPTPAFPPPTGIVGELLAQKCPPVLAVQISNLFLVTATQLHSSAQANLQHTLEQYHPVSNRCQEPDLAEVAVTKLIYAFEKYYEDTLRQLKSAGIEAARQQLQSRVDLDDHGGTKKSTRARNFNSEYIPLLEKYFEYNPYPSAPDRALLARKSMMSPRQIEVWFQNHRNRAKKEGKAVHRRSPDEPPSQIPLEPPEEEMSLSISPAHERIVNYERSSSVVEIDNEDNIATSLPSDSEKLDPLAPPAPSHAFPTTYENSSKYTTFIPKSDDFTCPPIIWTRQPSPPSRKRKARIDMNELCDSLMGILLLPEPAPKKSKHNTSSTWFAHKQTIPSPAPHPALIQSFPGVSPPSLPASRHMLGLRTARRSMFQSLAPDAPLASLIRSQNGLPNTPKVAQLPKRTLSPTHRYSRTAVSDPGRSQSRISSINSHTSSFSSGRSSKRHISSSSCSSAASSTLTTPTTIPIELPEIQEPSSSIDDDYQALFGNFERVQDKLARLETPRFDASSPYAQTPSP